MSPPSETVALDDAGVDQECAPSPDDDAQTPSAPAELLDRLLDEFRMATGLPFALPPALRCKCLAVLARLVVADLRPDAHRRNALLVGIRDKLKLSAPRAAYIYDAAAPLGVTFNYAQKARITAALDAGDVERVLTELAAADGDAAHRAFWRNLVTPVGDAETLDALRAEFAETTNPRLKRADPTMTQRMLEAIFAAFLFACFDRVAMHAAITSDGSAYDPDFWHALHVGNAHLFERTNAAWFAHVSAEWVTGGYADLRDRVATFVASAFDRIDNHGVLAVYLDELVVGDRPCMWELAADTTLFAQHFHPDWLTKGYFERDAVEAATRSYIAGLTDGAGEFDVVYEGFTYLDCFVNRDERDRGVLLLFQKNRRDDTVLPCPACRSSDVRGNSYSTFGVRSWECQNFVCPDRSKSNRGKRFSFLSLLKQQAIEDEANAIPAPSLQMWRRDVVTATVPECLKMVVQHYSLAGDQVRVFGVDSPDQLSGRRLVRSAIPDADAGIFAVFDRSAFFSRFLVVDAGMSNDPPPSNVGDADHAIYEADALRSLSCLPDGAAQGAMTSPPYYNARDYAQWPNLYCHMYDMFNIARETFRVLTPGALYLYNLFDYFDNDRTVTFSALGKRRLGLSALTVHAFRRAGFELLGNVVWDKGEIEGKRGFNGGNASPYYQAPFNCWEHVLVFAKPGPGARERFGRLPSYLRERPVLKMVRGVNVHGHTAPFPDALPALLLDTMAPGETVLDPFAGSLTTARVAERLGVRSISIEREPSFVTLGLEMRRQAAAQIGLPI